MINQKPIIGISMGDPAGIGPEIAVKALAQKEVYQSSNPVIVGDSSVIQAAIRICNLNFTVRPVTAVEAAGFEYGVIDVFDLKNVDMSQLEYGKVSAMAGNAGFTAVKKLIELAMAHKIDATVTGPINKEAMNLAGHHFSGHTEIYAEYTGTKDYTMMLAHENFRVAHVSTHVSLRQACDRVQKERVLKVIQLSHEAIRKLGIEKPRIGVAGLNPHAGENGMFGREEIEEITPAIEAAKGQGILVEGPIPPDSLFPKGKSGFYDVVVAMYHDQGHIPLKLAGFNWNEAAKRWESVNGINITLGLPIIRSSVDHGTAFDIAGKGIATPESLLSAIDYAQKMARLS